MTIRVTTSRWVISCAIIVAAYSAAAPVTQAQTRTNFSGEWQWAVYAKSRDELPPIYRNEKLRDVPAAEIYLIIKQRGNKLTGEYYGSRRFLARLEEGDVDTRVKKNVAMLELASGFGGKLKVRLTLRGKRIHWKAIMIEGEHYFPEDVYLWRVVKRRPRR